LLLPARDVEPPHAGRRDPPPALARGRAVRRGLSGARGRRGSAAPPAGRSAPGLRHAPPGDRVNRRPRAGPPTGRRAPVRWRGAPEWTPIRHGARPGDAPMLRFSDRAQRAAAAALLGLLVVPPLPSSAEPDHDR